MYGHAETTRMFPVEARTMNFFSVIQDAAFQGLTGYDDVGFKPKARTKYATHQQRAKSVEEEMPNERSCDTLWHDILADRESCSSVTTDDALEDLILTEGAATYFTSKGAQKKSKEVSMKALTLGELDEFAAAKEKEWQKTLAPGALRRLSDRELSEVMKTSPERVCGSRYVCTWKCEDNCPPKAKARWCVQGHGEADSVSLKASGRTSAPTLSQAAKMLTLACIAGHKWELQIADIEGAFLQTPYINRCTGKVYVRGPCGSVYELAKPVYGLDDAPMLFYEYFCEAMQSPGFQRLQIDPCLLVLRHPQNGHLCGVLSIHADDSTSGGYGEYRDAKFQELQQRLPFRKVRRRSGEFVGSQLTQVGDGSIWVSQENFTNRLQQVRVPASRGDDEPVDEGIRSQVRGLLGSGSWLASQSRPGIQALCPLGQQMMPSLTYGGVKKINQLVRRANQFSDLTIPIPSIDPAEWEFASFSDASNQNASGSGTQAGSVVCLTKQGFGESKDVPFSPLVWRSHRLKRVVVSTMSGETMALTESLGHLEWLLSLTLEIFHSDFDLSKREAFCKRYQSHHGIDAKSVYDHLRSHNPSQGCEDKRTGLDCIVGRESLRRLGCSLRWGPASVQMADVLTKDSAGSADSWRGS